MMQAATGTRMSARPRAGVLVLLFMLATVATPAVDTWLHGVDDGGAAQHPDAGDCVVCRQAATPWAPSPAAARVLPQSMSAERPRVAPVRAPLRGTCARLTPPPRAPPA